LDLTSGDFLARGKAAVGAAAVTLSAAGDAIMSLNVGFTRRFLSALDGVAGFA